MKEAAAPALAPSLQHLPSSLPSLRALSLALDFHHVLGSRFDQEWQVLRSRFRPDWQILRSRLGQGWMLWDVVIVQILVRQNDIWVQVS